MSLQITADIIDTISPLVTMAFGIFGATRDTKPINGKLTKAGRIAIWGIVLSATFTLLVKSLNLYYKGIQQEEQQRKNEAAEIQKAKKENENLLFQKSVDSSFASSIKNLKVISELGDANINETKLVNASSRLNLSETKGINKLTGNVLKQTQRIVNPLFPLRISVIYEVPANTLNNFWNFIESKLTIKSNEYPNLTKDLVEEFFYKYPSNKTELINLLSVNINLDIYKDKNNSENQMNFAHPGDDSLIYSCKVHSVNFDKVHSVNLDFQNKLFIIVSIFHEKKASVTNGHNFRGEEDLFNSYYTLQTNSLESTQIMALYIDKGWNDNTLFSDIFIDCAEKYNIPWQSKYSGFIKKQKNPFMCSLFWVDLYSEDFDD